MVCPGSIFISASSWLAPPLGFPQWPLTIPGLPTVTEGSPKLYNLVQAPQGTEGLCARIPRGIPWVLSGAAHATKALPHTRRGVNIDSHHRACD